MPGRKNVSKGSYNSQWRRFVNRVHFTDLFSFRRGGRGRR